MYMVLKAMGDPGFSELEAWVNEFIRGWHQKWLVEWENEKISHEVCLIYFHSFCD